MKKDMNTFLELFTKLKEEGCRPRFVKEYDNFPHGVVINGDHIDLVLNIDQYNGWNKKAWAGLRKKEYRDQVYTFINLNLEAMLEMEEILTELDTGFTGQEWGDILTKMQRFKILSTSHKVAGLWEVQIEVNKISDEVEPYQDNQPFSDDDIPF